MSSATRTPKSDSLLFWLALLASIMGLVFIFDAGYARSLSTSQRIFPPEFTQQAIFLVISLLIYQLVQRLPTVWIRNAARPVWAICFILLGLVDVIGHEQNEAKRWIAVGPISIQPSEFAKLGLIMYLAAVLADRPDPRPVRIRHFADWLDHAAWPRFRRIWPGLTALAAVGLVEQGKDLGTAGVLFAVAAIMCIAGGVKTRTLVAWGVCLALVGGYFVTKQAYRMERITNHFHRWEPENVQGIGFQTTQAERGIADGGLTGVGIGNGQVKHIIPAPTTDFIMATIGEETGLLGSLGVIGLLGGIVWRLFWLARRRADAFGRLVLIGTGAWFGIQTCTNVMMANAFLPAIGIPIPFISSGGSSLVSLWLAVGICQAVLRPRTVNKEVPVETVDNGRRDRWSRLPSA